MTPYEQALGDRETIQQDQALGGAAMCCEHVRGDGRKTGPKTAFLRHRILKSQLVLIDQFSPWKNCKTGYIMYRS